MPEVDGLDIAAGYLPAQNPPEVGGDWSEVLPLPDGTIGLAVGDVVGHDMSAAASMGQLRSVLRSYAWREPAGRVIERAPRARARARHGRHRDLRVPAADPTGSLSTREPGIHHH